MLSLKRPLVSCVVIMSRRRIVVYDNSGVINHTPPAPPNRPRGLEVEANLRSPSQEPVVEGAQCGCAKRHVRALEEVDVLEVGPEVVAPYTAPPPLDTSDDIRIALVYLVAVMNDVAAPDRADHGVGFEPGGDRPQPAWRWDGIVIRDREEFAAGELASAIERRYRARDVDGQHPDRTACLVDGGSTLLVIRAHDDQDL
ncbi:MAG TPA: hypothetical protein VGG41_04365 [Solirubrobacteraceae bacterium]|jgi:hypothetical protein